MKNKIHYSPESRRDLDDIWDYIVSELQNRSAAEHVVDRIMDAVDQLKNFAEMETLLSSNKIKIGKFYQKLADFSLCNYFFALSASSISLLKLSGFSISLGNS